MPRCCIVTGDNGATLARVEVPGDGPSADAAARVAAAHAVGTTDVTGPLHFAFHTIAQVNAEHPAESA